MEKVVCHGVPLECGSSGRPFAQNPENGRPRQKRLRKKDLIFKRRYGNMGGVRCPGCLVCVWRSRMQGVMNRRSALAGLTLIAGQAGLSVRGMASDDPPNQILPVYARGTAVQGANSVELCAYGEGNYLAYQNLLKKLPPGFVFLANSVRFSTFPCPTETPLQAPNRRIEESSVFCKCVSVKCSKFQMMGLCHGLTISGARRRALQQVEDALKLIGKTLSDCECLTWKKC